MEIHILNSESIAQNVARKLIGNYCLGNYSDESFIVRYVGRSDTCLQRRLKEQAAKQRWEAFVFRPTNQKSDPITEAFNIECREYHLLKPEDNLMHPDKPSGLHHSCPYCEIIDHSTDTIEKTIGGEF